jgi:hypothetical protein
MTRRRLNRLRALGIILRGTRISSNLACWDHGVWAYI